MNWKPSFLTASALTLTCVALAAPAMAQDQNGAGETASKGEERIVVTGSRIARQDYVAQSPIVTTDIAAIQQSGNATVDNYLRELPQFQPGSGEFSNNSSGGTIGQSNLNLRGLGTQRNLVIMDGRRLQPSSIDGAIDINTIPALAIGSVEVISGGASATYGSDAMSGVVNFRVRKDLEGLEATGQVTMADEGDGEIYQLGAAYGGTFAGGRGSFLLSGEYVNRKPVAQKDRPLFLLVNPSGRIPGGQLPATSSNLYSEAAVDALFASYGFGASTASRTTQLGMNEDGTLFVSNGNNILGANYKGPTDLPYLNVNGRTGYHGAYFNYLRSPLERYAIFANGDYELSDTASIYGQFMYSDSSAKNIGSEPIVAAGFPVIIPATNPFISADLRTLLNSRPNPNGNLAYAGRIAELGPRTYLTQTKLWQAVIGAKGSVESIGLDWDLYYSHGDTRNKDKTIAGSVSVSALNELAAAPDGGNSLCDGGWNPFPADQFSSQDCIDYVSRRPVNEATLKQDVFEAIGQGGLFNLPGGEVRYAVSGTYRRNTYLFVPDDDVAAGDIASVTATQRTEGKTAVTEFAAELLLPLLADTPGFQSLNVTLGYRYSDYDISGGAHTYKADFDWQIADPIMLRGGYQHALRAPNIGEYFQAGNQTIQGIGQPPDSGDPCDARSSQRDGANAAAVRDLCIATGIPADLYDDYQVATGSLVTQTVGNPNLQPEKADTFTIGAVLRSPFASAALSNMTLTVDYYNIEIKGAVATLNALDVLNKCYNVDGSNPTYDPDNFFCTQFERNGALGFQTLNRPNLNLGGYKTSGVDIAFNWRIPADFMDGSIVVNSNVNYLDKFAVQTLEDGPFVDWGGTISGGDSFPKWSFINSMTVNTGALSLTGRWRHISGMDDSSLRTNPASTTPGPKAYDVFDLTGKFDVTDDVELRAGINNLFDKDPLNIGSPDTFQTNSGVYDVIGRRFFVGFKARI